ncbi:hypothetical protein HOD29_04755 [archaeon]|nr:hypothetical protein [archaeon]
MVEVRQFNEGEKNKFVERVLGRKCSLEKKCVAGVSTFFSGDYDYEIKLVSPDFSFNKKFKQFRMISFAGGGDEIYLFSLEKVNSLDEKNLEILQSLDEKKYSIQYVDDNLINIFYKNQQFLIFPYEKKSFLRNYFDARKSLKATKEGGVDPKFIKG